MSRITTRIFLGIALLLAIAVLWLSVPQSGSDFSALGSTVAASLAVITAVVSAWGAQRVVELQEDKLQPHVIPTLDFSRRYGLVLFRLENIGGGPAYDVSIDWKLPLKDRQGKTVRFSPPEKEIQIPVLNPSESISKTVNGHVEFFRTDQKHVFSGIISYRNAAGQKHSRAFYLDADVFRETPLYDEESLKTHFEVQKIPDQLKRIEHQLQQLNATLSKIGGDGT